MKCKAVECSPAHCLMPAYGSHRPRTPTSQSHQAVAPHSTTNSWLDTHVIAGQLQKHKGVSHRLGSGSRRCKVGGQEHAVFAPLLPSPTHQSAPGGWPSFGPGG